MDADATLFHTRVKGCHIPVVMRLRESPEFQRECARRLTATLVTRI